LRNTALDSKYKAWNTDTLAIPFCVFCGSLFANIMRVEEILAEESLALQSAVRGTVSVHYP